MNPRWEHFIYPASSSPLADEWGAGGKGSNLLRLARHGFQVPPFLVISRHVFDEALKSHWRRIDQLLAEVDYTDQASIAGASKLICDILQGLGLPDHVLYDLPMAVEELLDDRSGLAVRSSVVGEDSDENSFAGQMDTLLNIHGEDLPQAIQRVWASAFSERALIYRQRKGLTGSRISAAVIVQQLVTSAVSGVMFTRHPQSRAHECVISAGYGLGEGVVSNQVETDTYSIRWRARKVNAQLERKEHGVTACSDGRSGSQIEPVTVTLQDRPALSDRQVRQLRGVGVRLERYFGAPQDVEWAFDGDGRLHILQSRPIIFGNEPSTDFYSNEVDSSSRSCDSGHPCSDAITANCGDYLNAAQHTLPANFHVWDNSNIVESYPGLTKPLTFSFIRAAYEASFRRAMHGFLLLKKPLWDNHLVFRNLIGLLNGRVYYDLLNWYRMLSLLPGFKRHKGAWDQMIGISERVSFPQANLSMLNNIGSSFILVWRLLNVTYNAQRFLKRFSRVYQQFRSLDFSGMSAEELVHVYESLGRKLSRFWHLTLFNDFSAMKYYDWLKALCERWLPDAGPNLNNNLLAGQQDVESVAPVKSLLCLSRMCTEDPRFLTAIHKGDDVAVWKTIHQSPELEPLRDALDQHLDRFGDRGLEELKLETPTFRESPARLIGLLRSYCRIGSAACMVDGAEQSTRLDAERCVNSGLMNPFKRLIFTFVLHKARSAVAARENMRFARSRYFGIVRRLFRRLGEILTSSDTLDSSGDIWYLTIDEVFGFVRGAATTRNLKGLVALRKTEYEEFARQSPSERISTVGSPYLGSLSTEGHLRRNGKALKGIGCSSGIAEGIACVAPDPRATIEDSDTILVAKSTDPGWVFLMVSSRGIVVEKGSVLSHTGIIGRELGIPTIVGAKGATSLIPHGSRIRIDGSTGEVRWSSDRSRSIRI